MLEKIGNKDVVVHNYTSNFDVKEFIQEVLIPKAFPGIPMNKLNVGFNGVISEYVGQAIEDSHATGALMLNEAFITKAMLPKSIYAEASAYDLGYTFATPSRCDFALQLSLTDVIRYSTRVPNSSIMRYVLDKDTKLMLGDSNYKLDYDIIIDHMMQDGKRIFKIYYDMAEENSISTVTSKYIKHQATIIDWLVLFLNLREFDRKKDDVPLTDNLITTNSEVELSWTGQIAGIDLVYINPYGERMPMKMKIENTKADVKPFVWYRFENDNKIILSFSSNDGYWMPDFNSKIEYTIYTCRGSEANFDMYNSKSGVPVQKTGERYSYNASTKMVALCYGGSVGGIDKGDVEDLRNDVIIAKNTCGSISTAYDLQLWYERYANKFKSRSKFFKRRDDPSGQLFSQFIAITKDTYIYPSNTLTISVDQDQFDFINSNADGVNKEFIIKAGHLWEYDQHFIEQSDIKVNDEGHVVMSDKYGDLGYKFEIDDRDHLIVKVPKDTDVNFYIDENGHLKASYDVVRNRVKMVKGTDGMAMISDETIPPITEERPFMFVNPFSFKINRDPSVSMNYNYLINHTSWPDDIPLNNDCFYQFQLATFSIERSLSHKYNNMYHIEVICVPTVNSTATLKYVEGVGDDFPMVDNNMRLVLIIQTKEDGETGYIEMTPKEIREAGSILFETDIAVLDNIRSDKMIEVDLERTKSMHSLILRGPRAGKVFIDSEESSFHFAVMMKDSTGKLTTGLFDDESFKNYTMANRFANDHRDLILYKPMNMMRSVIKFNGENGDYNIQASLMPFLKWDIPFDDEKMAYFIQAFANQYKAMEPVLSKLEGNAFLDFKLFNSYGRSNNYYIGPKDGSTVLRDSDILLDDVYVRIKLKMAVYDRSMYAQTANEVINEIISFFNMLNDGDKTDVHLSNIIHNIECYHPNVKYLRFLGFNNYDANKQSIFVKYTDISELKENELMTHIPEMIRVDSNSIEITEEI